MTAPTPDSMPGFRPSWALPILAGAGGVILWQLLISFLGASLEPDAVAVVSCCGCCSFPIVLGFLPALIAISRDPAISPGEGFAVSFIGVGAGVLVALVVVYMQTPISEMRESFADEARRSIEMMMQQSPDLELSEEQQQRFVDTATSVGPYMPVGIGLIAALLCGVSGMIGVIVMRGRRKSFHSTTSS